MSEIIIIPEQDHRKSAENRQKLQGIVLASSDKFLLYESAEEIEGKVTDLDDPVSGMRADLVLAVLENITGEVILSEGVEMEFIKVISLFYDGILLQQRPAPESPDFETFLAQMNKICRKGSSPETVSALAECVRWLFMTQTKEKRRNYYKLIYAAWFSTDSQINADAVKTLFDCTPRDVTAVSLDGTMLRERGDRELVELHKTPLQSEKDAFTQVMQTSRETFMVDRIIRSFIGRVATLFVVTGAAHAHNIQMGLQQKGYPAKLSSYEEAFNRPLIRQGGSAVSLAGNVVHRSGGSAAAPAVGAAAAPRELETVNFTSAVGFRNYLFDNKYDFRAVYHALDMTFSRRRIRDEVFLQPCDLFNCLYSIFIMERPGLSEANKVELINLTNELLTKNASFFKKMLTTQGKGSISSAVKPNWIVMFPALRSILETSGTSSAASDQRENVCPVCCKPANQRCSRCKTVYYCTAACQSAHWPTHKLSCKK